MLTQPNNFFKNTNNYDFFFIKNIQNLSWGKAFLSDLKSAKMIPLLLDFSQNDFVFISNREEQKWNKEINTDWLNITLELNHLGRGRLFMMTLWIFDQVMQESMKRQLFHDNLIASIYVHKRMRKSNQIKILKNKAKKILK